LLKNVTETVLFYLLKFWNCIRHFCLLTVVCWLPKFISKTAFDWLRLFVNERNLKIDVVLSASCAVVIRSFSLNEAPLGLFKFNSDYLPLGSSLPPVVCGRAHVLFMLFKDWSQSLFGSWRNNLNQVVHARVVQPDWGYFEWTEQIIN
jgi:hypothetical protein